MTKINSFIILWLSLASLAILIGVFGLRSSVMANEGDPIVTPTPNPLEATPQLTTREQALALAEQGVTRNADWTPYTEEIAGVLMALVPAGCFMMGSENGNSDEQPVHKQCFEEPFWLDAYEVTNAQFGSTAQNCLDYSSEPSQPRICEDWFDARDHCKEQGGRLPTEAEWEYAARGPDELIYPWGNEFVVENVVYGENSGGKTAEVGSRPSGASWVGAMDMSGNVWEWVSGFYLPYPYNNTAEYVSNIIDSRVLRGGSFFDPTNNNLRAADRNKLSPAYEFSYYGFRCARSFE